MEKDQKMVSSFRISPMWILTILVLLFSLWVLRSFLVPLTWAVIIAIATWPLYCRFAARMPHQFALNATPFLFTALVTLFILGPFGYAFLAIAGQVQAWAREIAVAGNYGPPPPHWLMAIPLAGDWLVDQWNAVLGTPGGVTRWLHSADSAWLRGWAGSLGQLILRHTMFISITVLGLFFLYRGGEPLDIRIRQVIHDKLGQRGDSYFQKVVDAVRATMGSMILVSLIDGVLFGLACAIAQVPSAGVWGAITGLIAMIPYVGYFAVAGVALMLSAKGASVTAVVLFGWGVIVVFVADHIIRPAVIGKRVQLGFFWVLLGGLGGLEAFGLLGVFIGPVILVLAQALWHDAVDGAA
ncbi:MAG TPA: AI-2E family transporter [Burkholderiales bacterium]|nr:AI-2E family transporter [Burkholderiales bacterium]